MNSPPNREVALFSAALELPASERAAYLDKACADDPALRLRLEDLLRVHEEALPFLANPAPGAQESPVGAEAPDAAKRLPGSPAEKAGDRIGRYKLLQQLGEGGCGVVYMAEQEEPVRRRVALKVIKLGMDTKQVIARFEAERQALALMDHPNIAKVLDAGATETGRPYFVMELVRGIKITDYCDEHNLSTEERLKLFTQVCQAIKHAHQKGIIHRDIKPSNILVTLHDGVPVPKVIDFGIAKATQGRLTDQTLFTAFEQFIGTPAYMSPEQAMMTALDIDTRTDIYSLGVLLYELLTGRTPFDAKDLMVAGLDAMRRIIREQEPARPSTRLSTMLASELTTTAKHRHTDPPRLVHLLRGDLDWIVMKALEKDRARRYDTANGLAHDVERFLADEPVTACPPSSLYRLQKLVRRNKLAFAAAAAVAAALVIGFGLSTWLLFRERAARQRAVTAERQANQARASEAAQRRQADEARANEAKLRVKAQGDEKKAETEAGKSRQVAGLFKKMLQGVGPSKALGRDTTMLREIMDKSAESLGAELTNQPEVEVEMLLTLAEAYGELGLYEQREAMVRQSLQLARSGLGEENQSVANSLTALGNTLWSTARFGEAETTYREALALQRKLFGDEHREVAATLHCLADALNYQGKLAEAETTLRQALAIRRKLLGNESPQALASLWCLAHVLWQEGKQADLDALGVGGDPLVMWRKLRASDNPEAARSLYWLAQVRGDQDNLGESEAMLRDALAIQRKRLGGEHPDVANSLNELGIVLRAEGKLDQAETAFRETLALQRKLLGPEHPEAESWIFNLASVLRQQGKLGELETIYRDSLARQRKRLGDEDPDAADSVTQLVMVLVDEGKVAEAEALRRGELASALARFNALAHDDPKRADLAIRLGHSQWRLAEVLTKAGQCGRAEPLLREALQVFEQAARDFPTQPFHRQEQAYTRRQLGDALINLGRIDEAVSEARAAVALYAGLKAAAPTNLFYCRVEADMASRLAHMLEGAGRREAAALAYRQAIALHQKACAALPKDEQLGLQLAELLDQKGTLAGVEGAYRLAAEQYRKNAAGGDLRKLNALAWFLATCPDSAVRDGPGAVDLAKQIVATSNRKEENYLDTLAAAYAAAGQFAEAVRIEKEALALPGDAPWQNTNEFGSHLRLYESGAPYLESSEQPDIAASLQALANLRSQEGKLTEAEALYREALRIRRILLGNENSDTPGASQTSVNDTRDSLADLLLAQHKDAEAEHLFGEPPTPRSEGQAHSAAFLRARRVFLARHCRWKEAAADTAKLIELEPADHTLYPGLASLLVAAGGLESYRQHCQLMVARFAATNDPLIAGRMAKSCLILASSGAEPGVVGRWLEVAMTLGTNSSASPWNQWVKGMAEYRLGHFAAAVDWMQKVLSHAGDNLSRDVEAYMVLAMALSRSKQAAEAGAALAKGVGIAETKLPKLDSGNLGDGWFDWIIAHALMTEAKALIEGNSKVGY